MPKPHPRAVVYICHLEVFANWLHGQALASSITGQGFAAIINWPRSIGADTDTLIDNFDWKTLRESSILLACTYDFTSCKVVDLTRVGDYAAAPPSTLKIEPVIYEA